MRTIKESANAEITVKKSKFIANIFPVNSEQEAKEAIEKLNKKYYDARHNCYAYIIEEKNNSIERFSDNGEPSGTAGAPMLDILKNKNLSNIIIIVTRYFGGILLGTGGLVKAYTDASLEALDKAEIIELEYANKYKIEMNYNELRNFEYNLKSIKTKIISNEYNENVEIELIISEENMKTMQKKCSLNKVEITEKDLLL